MWFKKISVCYESLGTKHVYESLVLIKYVNRYAGLRLDVISIVPRTFTKTASWLMALMKSVLRRPSYIAGFHAEQKRPTTGSPQEGLVILIVSCKSSFAKPSLLL